MRLVFVSNFLNHHQVTLCEALKKGCDKFYFVATDNVGNIGFQKATDAEYVVKYYVQNEKEIAEKLILSADVVIFGSCPNALIEMRMNEDKLSFLFSERFFKKGTWRRFIPKTNKAVRDRVAKYSNKKMYVLCASAYLPYDLSFFAFPKNRCFKWGYFPAVKNYNIEELVNDKDVALILWTARFIDWKHPEIPVLIAEKLKKAGYHFELNLIGNGVMESEIAEMIKNKNLEDCVSMLGAMKPEEVRRHMEKSQIFLFTSDFNEGWGAVLNESMNSGCAVVASHAIGSVPYLIDDGKNGLIYQNGDIDDLYNKVKFLLDNPERCKALGINAYKTLTSAWNAELAAERFLNLATKLLNNEDVNDLYSDGPCCRGKILKNNWR